MLLLRHVPCSTSCVDLSVKKLGHCAALLRMISAAAAEVYFLHVPGRRRRRSGLAARTWRPRTMWGCTAAASPSSQSRRRCLRPSVEPMGHFCAQSGVLNNRRRLSCQKAGRGAQIGRREQGSHRWSMQRSFGVAKSRKAALDVSGEVRRLGQQWKGASWWCRTAKNVECAVKLRLRRMYGTGGVDGQGGL